MPVGDLSVPGIGKNTVIPMLVQTHILISSFVIGAMIIAPTAEYVGLLTKQPKYEKFAKGMARLIILLFASGSAVAITFILALITLFPVFWSYMQNIFFWVLLGEAFMFVGEIALVYSWYNSWNRMAYRKKLHVIFGFMAGLFGLFQMTLINVVGSYMLTPTGPGTDVGATYFNPTFVPLNMHRIVGSLSYAGILIVGYAAWRYLRSIDEDDRKYYDWMGHWGIIWGFGFMLLQPVIGYGYMKSIREHSEVTFDYIMQGDKSWLFNFLSIELGVMGVAAVAYLLHKLRFAARPMPTLRNLSVGALGFMALFSVLNMIPANWNLVPQLGLVFFNGKDSAIPLGTMYPWKYIGLIGLTLVGFFVLGLYLRATVGGFHWGRASRWSQYALLVLSVTVVATMLTMGYTRETSRRAGDQNWLIRDCVTFSQKVVSKGCPAAPPSQQGSAVPSSQQG